VESSDRAGDRNTLLVDVGGVLLLTNTLLTAPIVAKYGGVRTGEDLYRAHCAAYNASHPTFGEPAGDYYDLLLAHAGVPEENRSACADEYVATAGARNMWHHPDDESRVALQVFKDQGIEVAIVSQADGHIAEMLLDAEMCQVGPGPGVEVDGVFDSTIVGFDKPDPRLFLHAVRTIGSTPERSVHVGDTVPADVVGAEAAGILAVHYDPYGDCDAPDAHEHVRKLAEMSRFLALPEG
jgi:putative hydrolase of the HAD superfamily